MDIDDIGKRLALYRAEKNLRQADVAKALGVTQQTIGNWEGGKPPKGGRLAQLQQYLNGHIESEVAPVRIPRIGIFGSIGKYHDALQEIDKEFAEALPEELRANLDAHTRFGGHTWTCDYLSAKVCAELKTLPADSTGGFISYGTERGLFDIATLRAIHRQRQVESQTYAFILIGPHPANQRGFARAQAAAAAHEITLYVVPDSIAAAALVADLEYGPME